MMKTGIEYPPDYRMAEVGKITAATRTGECVSVVGLSGSGKSNLLAFLAQQCSDDSIAFVLVDCNRLEEQTTQALFRLICRSLEDHQDAEGALEAVERALARRLEQTPRLCLLFDRFDVLTEGAAPAVFGNLRALRDRFKYDLTYLTATRRPLKPSTELAELFYANTLWLGPLSESDALWTVRRYAGRSGRDWSPDEARTLIELTWGYPALLRAACEAYAAGSQLEAQSLARHPALRRRIAEFWADEPTEGDLRLSGMWRQPLLLTGRETQPISPSPVDAELTAKEHLLLAYLQAHPGIVSEKDDLIRAVWPEDRIFEQGVRDDSLAQLVRRLRTKVEADPSQPRLIQTIPGRGYRYSPQPERG